MLRRTLFNLLPHQCPACEQSAPGSGLCATCASFLPVVDGPCQRCGRPLLTDTECGHCQQHPPAWQNLQVAWRFSGLARFLIHQFKYQRDMASGQALLRLWLQQMPVTDMPEALVAVPMHYRKHHRKGFNQADWLARRLSRELRVPLWHGAKRTLETPALEGLQRGERQQALKGAFTVRGKPPAHLVIVDDVLTSGATLTELARELKRAGCQRVDCWVMARTPLGDH